MSQSDKMGEANADSGVGNDPLVDVNVGERTAQTDDELNRGDQEGPEGARLVPGDRIDEVRRYRTASLPEGETREFESPGIAGHFTVTKERTGNLDIGGQPVHRLVTVKVGDDVPSGDLDTNDPGNSPV